MAKDISEEQARDYPPRLYAKIESRDINTNFRMLELPQIRESIGLDAWDETKKVPIGIISKLVDSQFVWSGKVVHFLLCNQLRVHKKELWFVVGGQPIRFRLNEFHYLTGLNIDPMPTEQFELEEEHKKFFRLLKVPGGAGPTLLELREALKVCRGWVNLDHRKWLGLLLLQHIGLYGLHHNSRIPYESAKRVFDDEAMKTYPWGRSAFEALVDSIKMLNPTGKSYTLSGFTPVLQAWAYESIKCFGERFGDASANDGGIPMLQWGGNRTCSTMVSVIAKEIKALGELRVTKMVMKDDVRELFHTWPDQKDDPAVDRLIQDIHEDKFVKGFWDVDSYSPPAKKQKVKKVVVSNSQGGGSGEGAEQKVVVSNSQGGGFGEGAEQKVVVSNSQGGGPVGTLIELVSNLTSRFDTFEKNIGDRIEERMNERFETRFRSVESDLKQMKQHVLSLGVGQTGQNNVEDLGDELLSQNTCKNFKIKNLIDELLSPKSPPVPAVPGKMHQNYSVNSPPVVGSGLAGISRNLNKEFDKDHLLNFIEKSPAATKPIQRTNTRKNANDGKKDEELNAKKAKVEAAAAKKNKELAAKKVKDEAAAAKKVKEFAEKKAEDEAAAAKKVKELAEEKDGNNPPKKRVRKTTKPNQINQLGSDLNEGVSKAGANAGADAADSSICDMTAKIMAEYNILEPESEDDEEEKIRLDRIKALRLENVKLSPDGSSLNKLQATQERTFPYIGDNGLTCMRKNCSPRPGIYDPLAPVDPVKLQKLLEYLKKAEGTPLGKSTSNIEFYRTLITERNNWPSGTFGWLSDKHLGAFMRLLSIRYKRDPFPFHNKRIAFIDPWFTRSMIGDYTMFNMKPKFFTMTGNCYEELVKGLIPSDEQTNLKWIDDVDHLYICPQTGGNHWVALHVDLKRRHIDCYDSIVGQVTEKSELKMLNDCRAFTRMIPAMMNANVPHEIRTPTANQFGFRRKSASKVPQNVQVGDCGVYALKFIECLALGVSFDGISDQNIQAIRVIMAAEIYNEAPGFFDPD